MRKAHFFAAMLSALFLCAMPAKAQNSQSVYPAQYGYPSQHGSQPQYPSQYPNQSQYASQAQYPVRNNTQVHYPAATTTYTSQQSYTGNYRQIQPAPVYNNNGIGQLPSYRYDQQLDPRYETYRAPDPNDPPASAARRSYFMGLETRSGIDVNGQFGYYNYQEPDLSVEDTGYLLGLNLLGTVTFSGFFATIDGRVATGDADYEGSGTLDNTSVTSWEWRGLFGRDLLFESFSLSPYTGFGYRTLYNDARGTTSTGAQGYRRYNELYYLPLGVHPRARIDSNARLSSTFEFDVVLHGLQKSDLSDAGLGDPNIKNVQSSGYGLRGDIMYETRSWSIGPYFNYWNIDRSKEKIFNDNSATTCASLGQAAPCVVTGVEPANQTIEAGFQFRYHFF